MLYEIEESVRRRAKTPHELFMFNLVAFHLFMAPAAIVLDIGAYGVLLLLLPLSVIAYTWLRGRRAEKSDPWFVMAHWKLAFRRSRLLLVAYVVSGAIISIGLWKSAGVDKQTTKTIILTISERLAVVPALLTVMVSFVLESGSIYQATRGEVPDGMVKRFPAPDSVQPATPPAG